MATLAVVLNTTKKLSNAEYAVAIRITQERQNKYVSLSKLIINQTLKFRCAPEYWKTAEAEDNGLGKFRKTFQGYKEYNAIIEAKLKEANGILKKYEDEGISFSFDR